VLKTIEEYREAGIETFIVSGIPLLEEAYRISEQILPHLPVVHDHNSATAPVGGDAGGSEGLATQTWNEQIPGVLAKSS
jgi:alkanesulfonate monooxygenase